MSDYTSPVRIQWQNQTIVFKSPKFHVRNLINSKNQGSGKYHMIGNFYEGMALSSIPDSGYNIEQSIESWSLRNPDGEIITTYLFEETVDIIRPSPINLLGNYWATDSVVYPENQFANTDIIWTIKNNSLSPVEYPPEFTGLSKGLWFPGETIKLELHVKSPGAKRSKKATFCSMNTNTDFIVKQLMQEDTMELIHAMTSLSKKYKSYKKGTDIEWLTDNKREVLNYLSARFSNVHVVVSPAVTPNGKGPNGKTTWWVGSSWRLEPAPINLFKSKSIQYEVGSTFEDYDNQSRQKISVSFDKNPNGSLSFYKPSKKHDWMLQIHF